MKRSWEIISDNLRRPDGVWAGSQPSIPKDERSGSLMHTAIMAKALPFIEASAKAELAGSIKAQPRIHFTALPTFCVSSVAIVAGRNKDILS